jgi:DnaJ-domain-containing protein 1
LQETDVATARTHYELLNIDPAAETVTVKAAFREQIARYHPDKVAHLGHEFQELAVQKTAELTDAYKTLISPVLRAQYDAALAARRLHAFHASDVMPAQPTGEAAAPRFAAERAGGDDIVLRALISRVRTVMTDLYGPSDSHRVPGFELALVPATSPPMMRSPFPRVFVRLRDRIDASQVKDACAAAARSGLHAAGAPINVLLFGKRLSDEPQIQASCEILRSGRSPDMPAKMFAIVIDSADWRALYCSDAPPALRRFIDRLRG